MKRRTRTNPSSSASATKASDQPPLDDTSQIVGEIEILGDLDRHTREALLVEIQQLAKRHGLDIRRLTRRN
jgi:hypothetical protein